MKRPISVSVVAWLIIIFSLFAVVSNIILLVHSDSTQYFQHFSSVLGITAATWKTTVWFETFLFVICAISGASMLKGSSWSRWVYTIAIILFWISKLYIYGFAAPLAVSMVICLLFIIFLFLPGASKYFNAKS